MPTHLFPSADDLAELRRPWKLATFALGLSGLLLGARYAGHADWDAGISLLMGTLTYALAPWSLRNLIDAAYRPSLPTLLGALAALAGAWLVVDGAYVLYHGALQHRILRLENLMASTPLYFLAGYAWLYRGSLREFRTELRLALRRGLSR